jgi:hypothetical protein
MVAADNPSVEVLPRVKGHGSLHRQVLAALGIPFGELWNLEQLSSRAADTGDHAFCVCSVPLALRGGRGTPAKPRSSAGSAAKSQRGY